MKEDYQKIKQLLKTYHQEVIIGLLIFNLFFLFSFLFLENFNLLKILIFIEIIIFGIFSFLFYKNIKIKVEEKKTVLETLSPLFDNLKEGLVIYDQNRKIIFVNKAFCELVELTKNDLINFQVDDWQIKNEKYKMLVNVFFPFLFGEDVKLINQKPEIISARLGFPYEKYLLIIHSVINLGKEFNLKIIVDQTESVLESQKKMDFLQLTAHHLLTPLNEINWQLETIDQEKLSLDTKEIIDNIVKTIKNTINFISSILSFISIETGEMALKIENVDMEKVFRSIIDILETKIKEKNIRLELEIDEKVKIIPGDERLLNLAFFSFVENAVFYNKDGGNIWIKIKKVQKRPYAQITVEDTGIGLDKIDLENLFKKYYRGKEAKKISPGGLGIGLYQAKKIIEMHGGELKIESEKNKGTKVTVYLTLDPNFIPSL